MNEDRVTVARATLELYAIFECPHFDRTQAQEIVDRCPKVLGPNPDTLNSFFHLAMTKDNREVFAFLLRQPSIDVNAKDWRGLSPLSDALSWPNDAKHNHFAKLLLLDPRIDADEHNFNPKFKPFVAICLSMNVEILRFWLALGKPVDLNITVNVDERVGEISLRHYVMSKVRDPSYFPEDLKFKKLIVKHELEPEDLKFRLSVKLLFRRESAAYIFCLMVFFCDGFLVVGSDHYRWLRSTSSIVRFFEIAAKLPLDLQMLLANKVTGQPSDVIIAPLVEQGFRCLARQYRRNKISLSPRMKNNGPVCYIN